MRFFHDIKTCKLRRMLAFVVLIAVLVTSVMSGILGMAGGIVLMALLITTMSVASAMILHGAVQATSNGSRAWFLREHIVWTMLPAYIAGSVLAVAVFALLAFVPHPGVVLIAVGAFAWLARFSKRLAGLDITHQPTAAVCGTLVTSAQLLAGASGPVLDVFYLRSPLSRQQIVASKALTQTIGHLFKIGYYVFVISALTNMQGQLDAGVPFWLVPVAMITAVIGARIGTALLNRWNDQDFQRVTQWIILTVATLCIAQGLYMLFQ